MQHEWNEALTATIGKIGLCINAMGSLFAFLLEHMPQWFDARTHS